MSVKITENQIRERIKICAARIAALASDSSEITYVEELQVNSGAGRVDLAFIGSHFIGVEIKSSNDTLKRLPTQATIFSPYFDFMILVVDEKFLFAAEEIVPLWWGLTAASISDDRFYLKQVRKAERNPTQTASALMQLLWKDELLQLLRDFIDPLPNVRQSRKAIRDLLLENVEQNLLIQCSIKAISERKAWKASSLTAAVA